MIWWGAALRAIYTSAAADAKVRTLLMTEQLKKEKDMSKRLHPLHTPDWICDTIRATGQYPDAERKTGRTTIRALELIATAMKNPHCWLLITDHHPNECAHKNLRKMAEEMVRSMGLQHFHWRDREICFGTPIVERPKSHAERFAQQYQTPCQGCPRSYA